MVRAGVPSASGVPSGRSPSTAPALFRITFRRVGKPSRRRDGQGVDRGQGVEPVRGDREVRARRRRHRAGAPRRSATSNPAFWRAMAVTGPATPAPTTSARIVLSFLYHFRIFHLSEDSDIRRIDGMADESSSADRRARTRAAGVSAQHPGIRRRGRSGARAQPRGPALPRLADRRPAVGLAPGRGDRPVGGRDDGDDRPPRDEGLRPAPQARDGPPPGARRDDRRRSGADVGHVRPARRAKACRSSPGSTRPSSRRCATTSSRSAGITDAARERLRSQERCRDGLTDGRDRRGRVYDRSRIAREHHLNTLLDLLDEAVAALRRPAGAEPPARRRLDDDAGAIASSIAARGSPPGGCARSASSRATGS